MKRIMRVCNIHNKSYDIMKVWKCPECDNKIALEAVLPNMERREEEIKRKAKGRVTR